MRNHQDLKTRLQSVRKRIKETANACGRNPDAVRMIAVSKTIASNRVREAIEAGVDVFGENYVQEARAKIKDLSAYQVSWHFIGRLQSNKAKYAVRLFDLIHSVDSIKLARELNKQAEKINKIQDVLIQVNIGEESAKAGASVHDTEELVHDISNFDHLALKGLMTMPPFFNNPEKVRPFFAALRKLKEHLTRQRIANVALNELSMGMTGDFEAAIEEGATLVRIGTAIFGRRE